LTTLERLHTQIEADRWHRRLILQRCPRSTPQSSRNRNHAHLYDRLMEMWRRWQKRKHLHLRREERKGGGALRKGAELRSNPGSGVLWDDWESGARAVWNCSSRPREFKVNARNGPRINQYASRSPHPCSAAGSNFTLTENGLVQHFKSHVCSPLLSRVRSMCFCRRRHGRKCSRDALTMQHRSKVGIDCIVFTSKIQSCRKHTLD